VLPFACSSVKKAKSTAATASIVHPVILIQNLGRLADGVSVQSRDQSQMKVSIAHGLVSTQANNITIQKTAEVLVTNTPAKFSLASDNKLQLSSAATLPQVNVNTQVIDKNATVTNAPVRTMAVQKAIQ
jgi:low affinity Fe/Cu permease